MKKMIDINILANEYMEFTNFYGVRFIAERDHGFWQVFLRKDFTKLPDSKKYTDMEFVKSFTNGSLKVLMENSGREIKHIVGETVLVGYINHKGIK